MSVLLGALWQLLYVRDRRRATASRSAGVTVLSNVRDFDGNVYVRLWSDAARRAGARVLPLTAPALLGDRAAGSTWVHLQWPEWAVGDPSTPVAARRAAKLLALLAIARVRRSRVLVTAHNVWAHERRHPRLESALWTLLGFACTDLHVLSSAGTAEFIRAHPTFRRVSVHEIPHGNYEPTVASPQSRVDARAALGLSADARVFVVFGALRAYKGVEELVEAFVRLEDASARLVVAGRVTDVELSKFLERACTRDDRLLVLSRFLADAELQTLLRAADAVVLPYRRVLNSGSAILALTLGRPVLLPRTPTFEALRARVGKQWVRLFDGAIGATDLARLPRHADGQPPDLSWCSWDAVADELRRVLEVDRP